MGFALHCPLLTQTGHFGRIRATETSKRKCWRLRKRLFQTDEKPLFLYPPYRRVSVAICAGCSEGNNLVAGVMPNVSASQPLNPRPPAPVTGNVFFVHSEIRLVRGNAAATPKHNT